MTYLNNSNPVDLSVLCDRTFLWWVPLFLLMISSCGRSPAPHLSVNSRQPTFVNTAPITLSEATTVSDVAYGMLVPQRKTRLSFGQPGQIQTIFARLGDEAKSGQTLAEYNLKSLRDNETRISQAIRQLEGGPDRTQANRQQLEQQLGEVRSRIALGEITAPYDCIVTDVLASEGTSVSPSVSVFEVIENAAPFVECSLTEEYVQSLKSAGSAQVDIENEPVNASLVSLSPVQEHGGYQAILQFSDLPKRLWKFGRVVEVRITKVIPETGVWLPLESLHRDSSGGWQVFVPEPKGSQQVLAARPVQVRLLEENRAYLIGDFDDGERIVVNGLHRLVAGQVVQDADASQAPGTSGEGAAE